MGGVRPSKTRFAPWVPRRAQDPGLRVVWPDLLQRGRGGGYGPSALPVPCSAQRTPQDSKAAGVGPPPRMVPAAPRLRPYSPEGRGPRVMRCSSGGVQSPSAHLHSLCPVPPRWALR
uniref:Uncharacterized protein n=1 Tax=Eutreptiella gymnastica TaxID=73025 RepID=A0A7S4LK61_9EUGL